ncbi:hypothetical protein F4604DRAFT_1880883 [Suillus subluteus]|nr:hypothetical protein F4604DRAFT_1880883 [Suillus subluteus]
MAEFLYSRAQMSAPNINTLLDLWAASLLKHGDQPPFADHKDLYKTINNILISGISWQSFKIQYSGEKPDGPDVPPWMNQQFEVWYCDPREDIIAADPDNLGATFVLIILGSDKTTVSVSTGNNEYYPLYLSIGNIFHSSLAKILKILKDAMSKPEVVHFGPYIADYKEQVLLTSIVRNWCPRCLAPHGQLDDEDALCRCEAHREALVKENTFGVDMLRHEFGVVGDVVPFMNNFTHADIHQLIDDHLVTWVEKYLHHTHREKEAEQIMDDIDHRLAVVAPFTGLRHFPQGRGFKQWTGDDSKALMKIYLPAIEGHVPTDIIHAFRAFLEFCYLVQKNVITEDTILQIEDALHCLASFLHSRFLRQHAMKHYPDLIHLFGVLNGLCSSMTENKHIKAVKQPWHRSNKYNALRQMLMTNQRLDKIAALHIDFTKCSMLNSTCPSDALNVKGHVDDPGDNKPMNVIPNTIQSNTANDDDRVDNGEINDGPTEIEAHVQLAQTCCMWFDAFNENVLEPWRHLHPHDTCDHAIIPADSFPVYDGKVSVVNSASSRFYAPRLKVACVLYECAVVLWFNVIGDAPDKDTGMWVVQPSFDDHSPDISVIHIDAIYCAAHLLPIYGTDLIPHHLKFHQSLDNFHAFYVNKFVDHHTFEIVF